MLDITDLKSLKNTYEEIKKIGDQERIDFLDAIVSYCKFIGFDKDKTLMMLALVRKFIPGPDEKFSDCSFPDDVDNEFTKKILHSFDTL